MPKPSYPLCHICGDEVNTAEQQFCRVLVNMTVARNDTDQPAKFETQVLIHTDCLDMAVRDCRIYDADFERPLNWPRLLAHN